MQERIANQEINNDEITIDLTELLYALWSKAHIILLSGILAALLTFAGTKLLITPLYTSVTKVYVLSKQDNNTNVTLSDLQAGNQLTKDYMELVKSRPVLEQVIAILNLELEPEELGEMVTVETQADTRIITIKVENEDPKLAKEIADAIRESISIQITEIMDADSVNTVEEGSLPKEPSSPVLIKNMLIGAALGLFASIGVVVLIFMLDDTIKTPDDVERQLGLNVLTSIPIQEGVKKPKKVKTAAAKRSMRAMKR